MFCVAADIATRSSLVAVVASGVSTTKVGCRATKAHLPPVALVAYSGSCAPLCCGRHVAHVYPMATKGVASLEACIVVGNGAFCG